MCGIVGAFPLNKPDLDIDPNFRRRLIFYLHNEVLYHTIKRGEDATGIAVSYGQPEGPEAEKTLAKYYPDGEVAPSFYAVIKQAEPTTKFFFNDGSRNPKGQKDHANVRRFTEAALKVPRRLYHILGHTRKYTLGSPMNQLNNHPIMVGNIIGIHNGGVDNHHRIFSKHKTFNRIGEVDSEAIFHLLAENGNERALGMEDIKYAQERLEGARAVIAYNHNHPEKVVYWHNTKRPMESAYIPELGLLMLYSEKEFLEQALQSYQRLRVLGEEYTAETGEVVEWPALSYQHRKVTDNHGGVIDLDVEVDEKTPIDPKNIFETTLSEYSTSTIHVKKNNSTPTSHKGGASQTGSNFQGPGSKTSSSTSAGNSPRAAELEDYSHELVDLNNEDGADATVSVNSEEIVDDTDEDDVEYIYQLMEKTTEELEEDAEDFLFGEGRNDERLLKNKIAAGERKYSELIPIEGLDEEAYQNIFEIIYPEVFKDAWAVAAPQYFALGMKEAEELDSLDDEKDKENNVLKQEIAILRRSRETLKKDLQEERDKLIRAGRYVANIKGLLMSLATSYDLVDLEKNGGKDKISFSSTVKEAVKEGPFVKTDLRRIEELFCEKDAQQIRQAFAQRASVNKKS